MYSLVFQKFSGPPFSVRGVAEHSSVMSMIPPFFLLQEVRAWLSFRDLDVGPASARAQDRSS
jgi:hypothetical protein